MDSQVLFRGRREEYLDSIEYLPPHVGVPRRYEVVEVTHKVCYRNMMARCLFYNRIGRCASTQNNSRGTAAEVDR